MTSPSPPPCVYTSVTKQASKKSVERGTRCTFAAGESQGFDSALMFSSRTDASDACVILITHSCTYTARECLRSHTSRHCFGLKTIIRGPPLLQRRNATSTGTRLAACCPRRSRRSSTLGRGLGNSLRGWRNVETFLTMHTYIRAATWPPVTAVLSAPKPPVDLLLDTSDRRWKRN